MLDIVTLLWEKNTGVFMSISVNENTGEKVGEGMAFELPFKNCLNVWHCFSQVA